MTETIIYQEIAENIKRKIYSNIYKPNDMLSSEKELFEEYGVSRRTLRRAINLLVNEGLLFTVPGKGTFVCDRSKNTYRVDINAENFLYKGFDNAKLVYASMAKPDIYDVYNLQISPTEKIIVIKWLLLRGDLPVAYDIKTIPYLSGIPISEEDLGYISLYEILSEKYLFNDLTHNADVGCIMPSEEICRVLKIQSKSMPIVRVNIKLKTLDGDICGFNTIYFNDKEFRLQGVSM